MTRKARRRIHVLNGPNLGMLGAREPHLYGRQTFAELRRALVQHGRRRGAVVTCRQTDDETTFVRWVQTAGRQADIVIANPGAWTHTSVAVRDAVAALPIPIIEVHCTNIFAREPFRRHSFVAPLARGMIVGFGTHGYTLAMEAALAL